MSKFRIVQKNGKFKVQSKTWFRWYNCDVDFYTAKFYTPILYSSFLEAEKTVCRFLAREKPWVVVKEYQ